MFFFYLITKSQNKEDISMITKQDLINLITEREVNLNNAGITYDVSKVSIKLTKQQLQDRYDYLRVINIPTIPIQPTAIKKYDQVEITNYDNDIRTRDQGRLNQSFSIDDQVIIPTSKDKEDTGSIINDYYNIDLKVIPNIDNKTDNRKQTIKQKWIKPAYKKSLLQRLKDNPPIRSNNFQGIDFWVNKCVVTIPDNPTGTKLRQLLNFEVEKISVEIPENLQSDYGSKKITVRYDDCDDKELLQLIQDQYSNNNKSIWDIRYDPDTLSLIASIKDNVIKFSIRQLNMMYKRSNKYYENINHDILYSLISYMIQDPSDFFKVLKTPKLIAFNILLSLDDSYSEFISQIRVSTVNNEFMGLISLPIDDKTSKIIMIPDLNVFNGYINTTFDINSCHNNDNKSIEDIIISKSIGSKVKQNNLLSKRSKSDVSSHIDTSDIALRTYLSDQFLSLSQNQDLIGSRLIYEQLSKQPNKQGDLSLCYQEKLTFDLYYDDYVYHDKEYNATQVNTIRHSKDVIYREINKDLVIFLKDNKISQNKVLGRIGVCCTNQSIHYLGIVYIHKGCLSFILNMSEYNQLPEIKQFLSLHGIVGNNPITTSRIAVNWKQLLSINVIPTNKTGNISYDYKDSYPYRIID